VIRERAGHTTYPQLHTLADFCRHFAAHDDIRDGEPPTRFEDAERLLENTVFVAGKVDDAIGYDYVDCVFASAMDSI
jgi:hypothetical protein